MKKKFSHNGREYEIRSEVSGDDMIIVRVYDDGKVVSRDYGVSVETASDGERQGKDLVSGLFEVAESDFKGAHDLADG